MRHPFNFAGDVSPFLLQAQASGADVIAVASTGGDLINILKQAREFNIASARQQVVSFTLTVPDVASLGLDVAQGVTVSEAFYWNLDAETRAWSERFAERYGRGMPSTIQAGVYSVTLHYLRAVAAAGTTDTDAVMRKLHELPVADATVRNASLRAGRADGARQLPVSRQVAGAEPRTLRFLRPDRHHAGRRCVRPAQRQRLPRVRAQGLSHR